MKLSHIVAAIEEFAPRALQEPWDNSGLQISLPPEAEGECSGVLLCVDVTEAIIDEAVSRNCNLVLSHHPLIFKGLKALTGRTSAERIAAKALRAGVAVYSAHTSLDSTRGGISYAMARLLGAEVVRVLKPSDMKMVRVSAICPRDKASDLRLLLLEDSALAPDEWEIDRGSLEVDKSEPVPSFDIVHTPLTRVEVTVPAMRVAALRQRLASLPFSVSVDTSDLSDLSNDYGLGVVADFAQPIDMAELIARLKALPAAAKGSFIRANIPAANAQTLVRRIALCGGAGGEFIPLAEAAGAQAYISADIRYHDFADHREGMAIFDIGHFESENCAKDIFNNVLCKKFPNFAVHNSQSEKNPVIYL